MRISNNSWRTFSSLNAMIIAGHSSHGMRCGCCVGTGRRLKRSPAVPSSDRRVLGRPCDRWPLRACPSFPHSIPQTGAGARDFAGLWDHRPSAAARGGLPHSRVDPDRQAHTASSVAVFTQPRPVAAARAYEDRTFAGTSDGHTGTSARTRAGVRVPAASGRTQSCALGGGRRQLPGDTGFRPADPRPHTSGTSSP
jgi:hypothetical protein